MRAAFIDRDGVINEELGHVHRIADFHLLPGVSQGLRLLQDHGWMLVVVTNQSGIARGIYREDDFSRLTRHMLDLLTHDGVRIAGVYHCPHHPTAGVGELRLDCDCRKPKPGMLLRAASECGVSLLDSVIIGDKVGDLEAGANAGLAARILVESGHRVTPHSRMLADHCASGLLGAAEWVVHTFP